MGQTDAPKGKFTAIAPGHNHSCALRVDQTIACWGNNDHGQTDAPTGKFTAPFPGDSHSCALRIDQTIACWGNNERGQTDAPEGQFTAIAIGEDHSCALRVDQTIACWGSRYELDAPDGKFTAIFSSDSYHLCGLRVDQTIACWGITPWTDYGELDVPEGKFTAINAYSLCALSINDTIVCWGDNPLDRAHYVGLEDDYIHIGRTSAGWWGQPRGLLRVKFHVCTTPELASTIPDLAELIESYVAHANKFHAPYYAWQSSELLRVQFEAGEVLETGGNESLSGIYAGREGDSTWNFFSRECVAQVWADGDETGGVAHQFLEYETDVANKSSVGGRGQIAGALSVIYIRGGNGTEAVRASISGLRRISDISYHELDHNLGFVHVGPLGDTRLSPHDAEIVGITPDEFVNRWVFTCAHRQAIGWPVGEDRAACAADSSELLGVSFVDIAEDEDGHPVITWNQSPYSLPGSPVTGYKIQILKGIGSTVDVGQDGQPHIVEEQIVEEHNVSASERSFPLSQQLPSGRYEVSVIPLYQYGVGDRRLHDQWANSTWTAVPDRHFKKSFFVKNDDAVRIDSWSSVQDRYRQYGVTYELEWDPVANATGYLVSAHDPCTWNRSSFPGGNVLSVSIPPSSLLSDPCPADWWISTSEPRYSFRRTPDSERDFFTAAVYAVLPSNVMVPVGVVHREHVDPNSIPEWWKGRESGEWQYTYRL